MTMKTRKNEENSLQGPVVVFFFTGGIVMRADRKGQIRSRSLLGRPYCVRLPGKPMDVRLLSHSMSGLHIEVLC